MKFVKLVSFPNRALANLTANMLRGSGIVVEVRADDAAGLEPALSLINGVDLFVPEDQLDFALEHLEPTSKS